MSKDFIPEGDSKLYQWLKTFKQNLDSNGASVGLSPAQVADTSQLCLEFIQQIEQAGKLKAAAQAATANKRTMRKTHLQPIRKTIKFIKAQPTYSKTTGAGMSILPNGEDFDRYTYKAAFTARRNGNMIELRFKKNGIDAMDFAVQINDGEWIHLGIKMRSPFRYRPVGFPVGSVLKCRFSATAMKNDDLIGEPSNVVPFLYEVWEEA